jgi:prevent-host-death family protein
MMTKILSASEARANIYKLMDETAESHEPIIITGKRNNVVMISQEDFEAMQETLYLQSIPGMAESIIEGMNTPLEECSEDVEW